MPASRARRFALAALLLATGAATCDACRYSVRDLGFIDRGAQPPRLVVAVADLEQAASTADSWREEVRRLGFGLPVVAEESSGQGGVWLLVDEDRFPLDAPVRLEELADGLGESTRDLVTAGCLVLFLDNGDPDRKAADAIQQAVARAVEESELWEKPMGDPPAVVRWSRPLEAYQRLTLGSLGFDPVGDEPQAAVIYGRWRRLGPVFTGDEITVDRLARAIGVLGLDCECDLSRDVFDGPEAPHAWSDALAELARERLGFDPQHPMTELEARQILSAKPTSGRDAFAETDAFLGYEEIDLTAMLETAGADEPRPDKPPGAPVSASEPASAPPVVARPAGPPYGAFAAAVAVLAAASTAVGWWITRSKA